MIDVDNLPKLEFSFLCMKDAMLLDDERMRLGHWLGQWRVLSFLQCFGTLSLVTGRINKPVPLTSSVLSQNWFCSRTGRGRILKKNS